MMKINKHYFQFVITHSCNLSCTYCYEKHKDDRGMTFETAKNIVDTEIDYSNPEKEYEISFFGGEPFLEFDLIKKIVEYIENKSLSSNITFFATTNGTLLNNEIKAWLKTKPNFVCGLSLDGNRIMHNTNRSNSYDLIDLDFFLKTYPNQSVKMTISKESLKYLSQGTIFLHDLGFNIKANLAFDIEWDDDSIHILERELYLLINYYLKNPDIKPTSLLDGQIAYVAYNNSKSFLCKQCGVGSNIRTYDIDGTSYPCQAFMPLSIGEKKAKTVNSLKFIKEIPLSFFDEKCRSCVIRSICPTCYGTNYALTGNLYHKGDNMCRLSRLIIKARTYFKARQWELRQLHLSELEEKALLQSIILIQTDKNI